MKFHCLKSNIFRNGGRGSHGSVNYKGASYPINFINCASNHGIFTGNCVRKLIGSKENDFERKNVEAHLMLLIFLKAQNQVAERRPDCMSCRIR